MTRVTEVNGLRLAYRGFVAGLAGGYVWAAIAMTLAAVLYADPLRPLRPIALAISPMAASTELAFVLGLGAVQAGGALTGMLFAYFFARFFTVRPTMAVAAPAFALLAWSIAAAALTRDPTPALVAHPLFVVAALGYGAILSAAVPLRGEVTRAEATA